MPFVEERRVGEDEDEDGVQWGQVGYVFVCCQGSIKLFKNGGCPDEDHALSYMSLRARTTMASPRGARPELAWVTRLGDADRGHVGKPKH